MFLSDPAIYLGLVGAVMVWTIYGILRTIGYQYEQAMEWHDLKVRAHRLRLQQQRRLEALSKRELTNRAPTARRSAELLKEATRSPAREASDSGEPVLDAIPVDGIEAVAPSEAPFAQAA